MECALCFQVRSFVPSEQRRNTARNFDTNASFPGLSGRNAGKIPGRPQKHSQSFSWNSLESTACWEAPSPIIHGGITAFESEVVLEGASLNCCHGIPSSTEGLSDLSKGIAKGCKKKTIKGVHVCSRLLAFARVSPLRLLALCRCLSAFVCVCSNLLALPFVAPPSACL